MKQILRSTTGGGYLMACIVTLALVMVLSAVIFYAQSMTILQTAKENTELVLESFILKNAVMIYDSIKQGHDLTKMYDANDYFTDLASQLSLRVRGNMLCCYNQKGKVIYAITNPNVTYQVEKTLKLKANCTVNIPVYFAGKLLYSWQVPLSVTRSLTLKT